MIDKHDLDNELSTFTSYFYHVGTGYALAISLRDAAREEIISFEAQLALNFRKEANQANERITEATVEAMVKSDPDRLDLVEKYLKQKLLAEQWSALRDSFTQKGYMLKELAELYKINYYGDRPVAKSARDEIDSRIHKRISQ